jgi:hypothetical protein
MKWKTIVRGERQPKEFGIVDYKRCLAPEIVEKRIQNHNKKVERDYQRYQVMGMRKGKVLQICNKVS